MKYFTPELYRRFNSLDEAEADLADAAWDAAEAEALYTLLEREVVPAFYTRDGNGMPSAWISKMRASMARLTPRFSTNRVVREYTDTYYLPAAGG